MTETSAGSLVPEVGRLVIRFAGDSGDGMQLTGDRFTSASALFGNDLATLPEYPAEIRAPAGSLAGVSAFQVQISDHDIQTPGDAPDVLVAMNPAALRSDLHMLVPGGTLIVNADAFDERNLAKAGYESNPLDGSDLGAYRLVTAPMTSLTKEACKDLGVKPRDAERSKNFFALGLVSWMYSRPTEPTMEWIDAKFAGRELIIAANKVAYGAGHAFGETAELSYQRVVVPAAPQESGTYTNINGNTALAWGLVTAGELSGLPVFLGSYPITPATDILHELPLVIVDIQRGGPSTGLPTKTEAADLLMAMYGRHGEAPLPVVAASTPSDCFNVAIEAARIALTYHTPVILLSDGYLANGSEPWRLPEVDSLATIPVEFATEFNHTSPDGEPEYWPFLRDENLVRPLAPPGTPGLMHRIGGIEKQDGSGNVSYDTQNHGHMVAVRAERMSRIDVPDVEVIGHPDADVLVVGWGSTWGAITGGVRRLVNAGHKVAQVHLTHLNPFPKNLGEVLARHDKVLVPEMNLGHLAKMIRAEYLVNAQSIGKVTGQPFTAGEIEQVTLGVLND